MFPGSQFRFRSRAWCGLPLLVLAAIYLPDLGRGFTKDDFAWILSSRLGHLALVPQLFLRQNGFYRPLVSLSFAASEPLFGLHPLAYGLTNFALVLAAAAGLYAVARVQGLPWAGALLAASLWALNPHGIAVAILWISGRTSLLLTVFALGAAGALLRGRVGAAALLFGCALFSKEEAVLLPLVLFVWAGLAPREGRLGWSWRPALRWALASVPPLAAYFVLRSRTDAFLPLSAPPYYRLTMDPPLVLRNLVEYADRSCTVMAAAVLLMALLARRWPRPDAHERTWITRGLLWLVCGFGITLFVPVRSSLYACFPSVGSALAGAALAHALWRVSSERARTAMKVAAVAVPLALLPVYRQRNQRMVQTAGLSAQVSERVRAHAAEIRAGRLVVIEDDLSSRVNARGAFGSLLADAVRVLTGAAAPRVWIDPPPPEWREGPAPARTDADLVLVVRRGVLEPEPGR